MTNKTYNILLLLLLLTGVQAYGQVSIGGNVYGGGNEGATGGNTNVRICAGQIQGNVFGGARMANVGGHAFVNIDGECAVIEAETPKEILIKAVYGGNDIAGTVGTSINPNDTLSASNVPADLTDVLRDGQTLENFPTKNAINNSWTAFVRTTTFSTEDTTHRIIIGSVFGGGNGDYSYSTTPNGDGKYEVRSKDGTTLLGTSDTPFTEPELAKTYLEINGGCLAHVYGGGNNATVLNNTTISMNNTGKGLHELIPSKADGESDAQYQVRLMAELARLSAFTSLSTFQGDYSSLDYTSSRVFGGNNKATMAIHPIWNLRAGKIRDLYSGGNEGDMSNSYGLLLEIPEASNIKVENVYGGCRKADVIPMNSQGVPTSLANIQMPNTTNTTYKFPAGLSARVLVRGGDVRNVYGGNDITGNITGGTAVGIYTSIRGDVYGGGNGSYAYTDNINLKDDPIYGDFYYDPGSNSVEALTNFRPHVDQVSLRLAGKDASHITTIGGSVYVGGNSATVTENPSITRPIIELKIGSYVLADKVFLGNNGEHMVDASKGGVLETYKTSVSPSTGSGTYPYSTINLANSASFAEYMEGCLMTQSPRVVFDNIDNGDPATYHDYSSGFGSLFCGGNVGSMSFAGTDTINFSHKIIIFDKVVGGCNRANVPEQTKADDSTVTLNAAYEGGVLGRSTEPAGFNGDRLVMNLSGLRIQPMRWIDPADKTLGVEWNTVDETDAPVPPVAPTDTLATAVVSTQADLNRRLKGGNIYGGCYESGHVNGNVVININHTLIDRNILFDVVEEDMYGEAVLYGGEGIIDLLKQDSQTYNIIKRNTGVILGRQGMDVLGKALNVFGGGFGADTEIWGSTTINLNAGYMFQIFGGSEQGVIGKANDGETGATESVDFNNKHYVRNSKYTCTVNVRGTKEGVSKQDDSSEEMSEAEFIYGGGFFGPICGNTVINLGNGRVFNTFAGSCMADILGHTETYIGRQVNQQSVPTGEGFPYIRDYVYGGNDLGGKIYGSADFSGRVRSEVASMVHSADVTVASAYMEYTQGRAEGIFGGCFGTYDYTDSYFGDYFNANGTAKNGWSKPRMDNAFVNFRPTSTDALQISAKPYNFVHTIYGAGQGYPGEAERDIMQNRSYVLIDIPQEMKNYQDMEVFGAGAWGGVGMYKSYSQTTANGFDLDKVSAIIDLTRGQIGAAYGGSYAEGVTRRTMVSVPTGSTIRIGSIFGGAYGTETYMPCDVYESHVEYHSADAVLVYDPLRTDNGGNTIGHALKKGAIYGGNNNERRTLYAKINIDTRVNQNHYQYGMTTGNVYGAGYGGNTWAEYTEVNLNDGAEVYEVYGGGQAGKVLCSEAITSYKELPQPTVWPAESYRAGETFTNADFENAWRIGDGYEPASGKEYWQTTATNLTNALVRTGEIDDRDWSHILPEDVPLIDHRYNTNVIIREGAYVGNYAYGAGLGQEAIVAGHTYIALLGGEVNKDIYAGGTSGAVEDAFGAEHYSASNPSGYEATTTAYVKGGTVRNVYGGGWRGAIGYHPGEISDSFASDLLGQTHVVIGDINGTSHVNGIPSITRNVYGGGEGGAVYGTSFVKINNGYIGYRYKVPDGAAEGTPATYVPELDDAAPDDGLLLKSGNVFGGGYVANSYVDISDVQMFGGTVRGCVFGGGEIGPIGRGTVKGHPKGVIYKAGEANVTIYGGHVLRDVFGGGRGYDNWNGAGYMTPEEERTMDLSSKGYVFGKTKVNIHGGEIGTEDGVAHGFGNIFGGGDRGFVFSAYNKNNGVCIGIKNGDRYDGGYEGYYYAKEGGAYNATTGEYEGGSWVMDDDEYVLTEDCKVLVEPNCKVKENVTINGHNYSAGKYVLIEDLNTLGNHLADASTWNKLDDFGVIIHNAVFAGGNVSSGDDQVYANAPTVFGNATASIHDIYNRDLITVGTGHVGGLYGDGNLTFVDGYRGLNITNYGTDYFNLQGDIEYSDYQLLTDREKAYYELRYKCAVPCTDREGRDYAVGDMLSYSDLLVRFEWHTGDTHTNVFNSDNSVNSAFWQQNGVCSLYAGRIMNTIQRADFCGVFGSRLVLQGAPDRVPETVDYTNYTINRVREVSLNKKTGPGGYHGNYFGIYSIVNFLGALTSDVNFSDVRVSGSDNTEYDPDFTGQTYYEWKQAHYNKRKRNRGSSHNLVALASGVYLELTSEKSTGKGVHEKDWGYVTGVIGLDLINVQPGIGGGYVYAKNVHGVPTYSKVHNATLTTLNADAVTRKDYTYSDDSNKNASDMLPFETSGNFIHDTQTIIDDCYDVSNSFIGNDRSPAHYWFIKGEVYVYEQYISSYTGAPAAYKQSVNIPLTITAASHGKLKLLNIQPNLYAYYKTYTSSSNNTVLGEDDELVFNNKTYTLNQPIDYWAWSLLSPSEQALFVEKTYTTIAECTINGVTYPKGKVMLPSEYQSLKTASAGKTVHNTETNQDVDFDFIFRESNNVSHNKGYILTYEVNNPKVWDEWYTPITGSAYDDKIDSEAYGVSLSQSDYNNGPTYTVKTGEAGIYGQREYVVSNIIDNDVYTTYQTMIASHTPTGTQAVFKPAYIVTVDEIETQNKDHITQRLYLGSSLARENYTDAQWSAISSSVAPAYVCTTTIQLGGSDMLYTGDLMTAAKKQELITAAAGNAELTALLENSIVQAHYCTQAGLYGGNYFAQGNNYRGLEAWSSLSPKDREHFTFNYDALDVLIDSTYSRAQGLKFQYDGLGFTTASQAETNKATYSLQRPVDYLATYNGTTPLALDESVSVTRSGSPQTTNSIQKNDVLTREVYESLPNEQYHYSPIGVQEAGTVYVVNESFIRGDTPYAAGQVISASTYNSFNQAQQDYVTLLTFAAGDVGKTFYYCRDEYKVGEHGGGVSVTSVRGDNNSTYANGDTVRVGAVITSDNYTSLVNKQMNFMVQGTAPVETSTLYVSRNSDIFDLSTEKIITVVYQYDYEETDESGLHVTPVSERHVLNIHLQFKSGIPTVETITAPDIVLPGTNVVIRTPNVTPGAYEVLGGGWEIYRNAEDAESHINGIDYSPAIDPLYWYQDGYRVAYYAKTYLGKTFSNDVPVSVANYHDLKKVMDDTQNHYYVDNTDVKREPKIYINDYRTADPATSQNGLALLKDFFDLSLQQRTHDIHGDPVPISTDPTNKFYNHVGVDVDQIGGGKNLEFFLRTDLSAPEGTWTPIGNDNGTQCFEGILHGDGHTISGLSHSLFAHLCGEVYNLGVTGSFTTAGIADEGTGFVENCWVKSTATATSGTKAIFNEPTNTATRTNHIVNSYYPSTGGYTAQAGTTAKSDVAFYNGEVTYDLNEFYLFKRYCDNNTSSITSNDYSFWKDVDGTLTKQTGHYSNVEGPYLVNDAESHYIGSYVESRFADGDFIYAGGSIPGSANVRLYTDPQTEATAYYPIWPDDYIFFGQTLTYGHVAATPHQPLPSVINRNGERLPDAESSTYNNRVYRAPAYYRSLTMGVAHFNPNVVLAQTKKDDATLPVHQYMTAIDFTGTNGDVASGFSKGWSDAVAPASSTPGGLPGRFYPPLLDDDGIFSIQNVDLTKNLLVYTGIPGGTGTGEKPTAMQQTGNVVSAYLLDQAYAETNDTYHTVDVWDSHSGNVRGHWVQGNGTAYTATLDHFLVDREDFNAPVTYTFASGKRMWHQRTPDVYAQMSSGWEGISLPFNVELVTTQTKGELTHFYAGSTLGHEYWLRRYTGGAPDANNSGVFIANFNYPEAYGTVPGMPGKATKEYTNTFLWDYYYSKDARRDDNTDIYKEYYRTSHDFDNYPYAAAGTPYIVGFPGTRYYEFDLSGTFEPLNTYGTISSLEKQTITFASPTGVTIAVSDPELAAGETTANGYAFRPNYLGGEIPVGNFVLNAAGSSYDVTTAVNAAVPFRPYFTEATAPVKGATRAITFNTVFDTLEPEERPTDDSTATGRLDINSKRGQIIVTSGLLETTTVHIFNTGGALMATYDIEPGQTVKTRVPSGVYLVNKTKIAVK